MRTVAVLPVKSFPNAKQRLSSGLDPQLRRQLAEVMLCDVVDALAATTLDGVIVVTAGDAVAAIALERGISVIREGRDQGHNTAAELGVKEALRLDAERALLVPGDCPALDAGEIDELLARSPGERSLVIVPDRHGTGTNALLITPPDALAPSFGPGSCQRHVGLARAAGIAYEVVEVPSLALDIDTPQDLDALAGLAGRATRTHGLLSRC
jgi:2-phospho-L-lactate/phosphoenolpyruvate guanylyltransferase